ncbi:acyl-CoA carboxylase subunit epsilon [Streptomyces sp. NPDC047043]|uniref:acyl-CoA carboxylase subunit epsilon n=1 Tax=Streptomyces sp. NPDC047043 TaxID=3154497 RepID=UPI00340A53E2
MTTSAAPVVPAVHLTVVRGDPDPEDLAALIGALIGTRPSAPEAADSGPARASWDRAHRVTCPPAGSWRAH